MSGNLSGAWTQHNHALGEKNIFCKTKLEETANDQAMYSDKISAQASYSREVEGPWRNGYDYFYGDTMAAVITFSLIVFIFWR